MNRKKHFLLILVALVLSFTLAFSLIACDRNTGDNDKKDETPSVINGTFSSVESETYPKVPSKWTAQAGSTAGSQATPSVQGEDVLSGVINVDKKIFNDNAKKWKLPKDSNPLKPNNDSKDNNVLMINNLVSTAYKYSSGNVTIEKGSYYRITISAKTVGDEAKAFAYVLGDAFAEFKIVTGGAWNTYTMLIEGATNVDKTVSLVLANGYGDKVNGTMSKGVAYFDDITVEKLEKDDDANYGKNIYDTEKAAPTQNTATYSMKMPDSEFQYVSGTTAPFSPAQYRGYAGKSDTGNNAPTSSSYVNYGVVDTALDYSSLGLGDNLSLAPGAVGTKMLFINNKKNTAYGYRSTVPFVLEAGKIYQFSIYLNTSGIPEGKGAILKLMESGSDKEAVRSEAINVNEWTKFTMDITANQLATKEVYFELWLGEGGKNDEAKWTTGTVFADLVNFREIDAVSGTADKEVSFATTIDNTTGHNKINNGYVMTPNTDNGWKEIASSDDYNFVNSGKATHQVYENVEGAPIPLPGNNLTITTDGEPVILTTAMKMSITEASAYGIVIKNGEENLKIDRNGYYKVSMWVRTDLQEKYDKLGLNIRLMQVKTGDEEKDKEIASFTNINTRNITTNANKYVEVSFYVEGSSKEAQNLYLEVMLGSGTRFTPATHVVGDAYLTLVGMEEITHDDYVKASTSTYSKKSSLTIGSTATPSIGNGNFTDYDVNATYDNYLNYQGKAIKDMENEAEKLATFIDPTTGAFIRPTAPTSWSISNKSYLETLDTGLVNSNEQMNANLLNKFGVADFNEFIKGTHESALVLATKPSGTTGALTIPTSPETCGCDCEECKKKGTCDGTCTCDCLHSKTSGVLPVGYSSSSISLAANSFYRISVKVKVGSGNGFVILSNNQDRKIITVDNTNKEWKDVVFYINTGLSATSIKLELYLGNKGSTEKIIEGAVAFDNASFVAIDKDTYANADTSSNLTLKAEFINDSFNVEDPSDETLTAPNNWNGGAATGGNTDADAIQKGVFDKNYSRSEWLYTTDADGNKTAINDELMSYLIHEQADRIGNNFLVINNIVANGFSFTNSSDSKTLAKDSYYEISVDVLTYGLKATDNAYISLKLNNVTYTFDNDSENKVLVNTSTYEGDTETRGEWTNYKFFVKTPENTAISNVTITLGLGKASGDDKDKTKNFVQGYAFFDNVMFQESNKETFDASSDGALTKKIAATDEDMLKPPAEDEKKDEDVKPQNNLLWVYITSGVIGGLIIIVVIGVLLKKYWSKIAAAFNKNKAKNTASYDKNSIAPKDDNNKKNKKNNSEFKD